MYLNYFGLQALPFSIAPNPQFLFMSDRHREALSHLTYGLGDTGGFVLLTGEVGTGKTTVSRCLLEQLPENTQVAFILNPTLSSHELLATICDELKIRYRKTGATLKTLTDKIQTKLLKNHTDNINTVLIIDEAQHLQAEVLEQLRLLTNLETNTKKLLQVVLIGQPELQQLLQRQDLRQLAQRITARYHLMPLTQSEVVQYISHRLDVVKSPRMLFDKAALSTIFKLSKGIPRLINLLCDRSLLKAYSNNNTLVNKKTVMAASIEALGYENNQPKWSQKAVVNIVLLVVSCVFVISAFALYLGFNMANQVNNNNVSHTIEEQKTPATITPAPITNVLSTDTTDNLKAASSKAATNIATDEAVQNKVSTQGKKTRIISDNTLVAETFEKPQQQKPLILGAIPKPSEIKSDLLTISSERKPLEKIDIKPTNGVSPELYSLFKTAVEETERLSQEDREKAESKTNHHEVAGQSAALDNQNNIDNNQEINKQENAIKPLIDMPTWLQNSVPKLSFEMHIYASNGQGWVRVNGRERYEGDYIADGLKVITIEPQDVVLSYQGEVFSLPSLSTWE